MSPRRRGHALAAKETTYGATEFQLLADDLARVPPELRRALSRRLRPMGQRAVANARARAAAWSRRIPGAIGLEVRFAGKNPGILITVDHTVAPHGRAYEGIVSSRFRHPLFGDRDRWYGQDARPYVWPAIRDEQQQIAPEAEAAIDEALNAAGL